MEVYEKGRQPRREVSRAVRYIIPEKQNLGIGAEEKLPQGEMLVEKYSDKSEGPVCSMGTWEITLDSLLDSGPQRTHE